MFVRFCQHTLIDGFNATSTLRIGNGTGTYSKQTSGNDVVVNVGINSITLLGAASLSAVNIIGTESSGEESTPSGSKHIVLTKDNTTYRNSIEGATIEAQDGNDYYIVNAGANVSISGADGKDSIGNTANGVNIRGNGGDDYITNEGTDVFILGGASEDSIQNIGSLVLIGGNEGNDEITNWGANVSIVGGSGDDFTYNIGDNVSIVGNSGDDTLINEGNNVTITGGAGYDMIGLMTNAQNNLICYDSGDGNDTIFGFDATSTLRIGDGTGTYSTRIFGSDIFVNVGTGVILLKGAATVSPLNIVGTEASKLFTLTEGDDDYTVTVDGATIKALGGNDTVSNDKAFVSIDGGADNDTFENSGEFVVLDGNGGDDSINNKSANVIANGGAGNDSIVNGGADVTINTGAGNDRISLSSNASGNMIEFAAGDGFDTVWGFSANSMLNISTENYTRSTVGNDVVVKVGNDSITLVNAASLELVNIIVSSKDNKRITLTEGNDNYTNYVDSVTIAALGGNDTIKSYNDNVSINGGAGEDYINNYGANVTFDAGSGNDTIWNYGKSVTIDAGDGNDYISNDGANVTIDADDGNNDIFNDGDSVIIVTGDGNNYISNGISYDHEIDTVNSTYFTVSSGGNSAVIFGDDGNDTIYNGGSFVTIEAGAGDDSITSGISKIRIADQDNVTLLDSVNGNGDLSEIFGGAGNDTIYNGGSNVTITGGTGDDRISLHSDAKDNVIQYSLGDGNDTITGFNETLTLNILAEGYSSVARGDDIIINVGNGSITLKDARNKPPHIVLGESGSSGGSSGGDGSGGNGNSSGGNSGNGSSGSGNSGNGNSDVGGTSSGYGSNRLNPFLIRQERQSNPTQQPSATPTTPDTPAQSSTNQNVYTGGDQVIPNYNGEKIIFGAEYTGAFFDGNNFYFGSTTGVLAVQNATDKFIDLSDGAGNDFIKAYAATTPGIIDGRGLAGFEIFNGSNGSDAIFAGNNGSQLWGGADNLGDFIVGGNGSDIFIAGKNQGADLIFNASANDIVHLNDATVSDIVSAGEHDGTIVISFNTGNIVAVQSSEALSATFRLADGAEYQFNHAAKTWQSTANQNIYSGGDMVISNYAGEKITFAADYTGSAFADGNFYFGSTTGTLIVQNAADKFIDLSDGAGNDFIKAYAATTPGIIDGRGLAGFDVFNGSSGSDAIFAGNGGSQLWGGAGNATDVFVGGEGADIFVVGKNQGADMIFSASANDIVHFNDASLSDIVATSEIDGNISIAFNTGNVITVQSTDDLSARFLFADGSTQRFNHSTKTWQ